MKQDIELKRLYIEAEKRYRDGYLEFDEGDLRHMINNLYQKSKNCYLLLSEPKTCNSETYSSIWIWDEIGNDIAKKEAGKPFIFSNPPPEYKFAVDFLKRYPAEYVKEIKNRKVEMTKKSYADMDKRFVEMVEERNKFSLIKGYGSRVEMYLKKYKITISEYKKFLKNVDKVILDCNEKLLKLKDNSDFRLSKHCFVCDSNDFIFKSPEDFLEILGERYPIIKENIKKIDIKFTDCSETKYIKETDSFEITLDKKLKTNHQKIDLIHEMAHVISYLVYFKKGKNIFIKGRYFREKLAIETELKILKKYYPSMFVAKLGVVLHNICQTLFEIELYQNPRENQSEEFAMCLRRCFKDEMQKNSYDYLLNPDVLYESFSLLPYVVADVNILMKQK